jgi:hypothetical protein
MQHPIGITVPFGGARRAGLNEALIDGPADWISPNREAHNGFNYRSNPPPADAWKVVLSDTDHLFGTGCKDAAWVWKTFTRGHNPLYMDMWTLERGDPARRRVRASLGYARAFSERIDLRTARPYPALASTGYCLASPGRQYLVYLPEGNEVTVDFEGVPGTFEVEWFNPGTGDAATGRTVYGGAKRSLKAPFEGDAVLFIQAVR